KLGMLGNAYPEFFHVETSFGPKAYRIGNRGTDSLDVAMMAAMELSARDFPMKCEASPKSLRGLSHREVGDFAPLPEEGGEGTLAVLMETLEPFIDRVAGKIAEEFMMEGKDEFLQTASEHGLLYCLPEYDIEFGAPMKYRVGRHFSSIAELVRQVNDFFPEKEIFLSWLEFNDLMERRFRSLSS
ncbi:MAG TPA: hypothetical protein PLW97_12580, partial [Synergistaceae bacterium]|nr:hypothetical protein [Synergistaceae bacterium]